MMAAAFELFLFSADPDRIRAAVRGGLGGVIVDWEHLGKRDRQRGYDTEINRDTIEDLRAVRRATSARVLCRVNNVPLTVFSEIDEAIAAGADEIIVPMARGVEEIETILDVVNRRCDVGIMVETEDAVRCASELGRLPISRAYLGLNDLAIDRGSSNQFLPLIDGTLESVRSRFDVPFGVAGLTLPNLGAPIPCRLLIGEMARLGCSFSFLRRSFRRDAFGQDWGRGVRSILDAVDDAKLRTRDEVARDHESLALEIQALGLAGMECRVA